MKIDGTANSTYRKMTAETLIEKASAAHLTASQAASRTDCVEISSKAYEAHPDNEKLTATSGKDVLGITKGSKDGSFEIHFTDSAMVSRAVARGYITVNGVKIELTDDIKKQLIMVDKQAQADRERAHNEYVMQHELAVAQQQGESYAKVTKDMTKAFETSVKIANGERVSPADERQLMEVNPQLYSISKSLALLAKQKKKQDEGEVRLWEEEQEPKQTAQTDSSPDIVWNTYETKLAVSLTDTVQLQGVTEVEVRLKGEGDMGLWLLGSTC